MQPRAIKDLSQLSDADLFVCVAEGLSLILTNARRLYKDAESLVALQRYHGARVLRAIAEEEAAKFLILIDAMRCPRQPANRFSAQLSRFNDHLAKGLYSQVCYWRPSTLGQLQEYLDNARKEFYLDGPLGVDWIFRNDVIQWREALLYVDYVAIGDEHCWLDPSRYEKLLVYKGREPRSLAIANTLFEVGLSDSSALSIVAEVWRSIPMRRDLSWRDLQSLNRKTLETLEQQRLRRPQPENIYTQVINEWPFPLYDLDLKLIKVDKSILQQHQENWSPDW